jgi:hypothetical protein
MRQRQGHCGAAIAGIGTTSSTATKLVVVEFCSGLPRTRILNMATPNLPQEMIDSILVHFEDDKSSLTNCSLVCHSWASATSRPLFRELTLFPGERYPYESLDWFEKFLTKIQRAPRVRQQTRALTFTTANSSDARLSCNLNVLQHILASFPHLASFKALHLNISAHVSPDFARELPPVLTPLKLHTIDLGQVLDFSTYRGMVVEAGTPESTGLAEFLEIFDEIGELRIENGALPYLYPITWHLLEANPVPLSRRRPLRVEAIHLVGYQAAKMLGVLFSATDPIALQRLHIELSPRILQPTNLFLENRPNIEHMNFSLRRDLTALLGTVSLCLG